MKSRRGPHIPDHDRGARRNKPEALARLRAEAVDPETPPELLMELARTCAREVLSNPVLALLFVGDWDMWARVTGKARKAIAQEHIDVALGDDGDRRWDLAVAARAVASRAPETQGTYGAWWLALAQATEEQATALVPGWEKLPCP